MPTFIWLTPKVLEIRFDSTYELCNSTYLFSHHYEDPTWHGTTFTRAELDEYYETERGDAHWWKKRWSGSRLEHGDGHRRRNRRAYGSRTFSQKVNTEPTLHFMELPPVKRKTLID